MVLKHLNLLTIYRILVFIECDKKMGLSIRGVFSDKVYSEPYHGLRTIRELALLSIDCDKLPNGLAAKVMESEPETYLHIEQVWRAYVGWLVSGNTKYGIEPLTFHKVCSEHPRCQFYALMCHHDNKGMYISGDYLKGSNCDSSMIGNLDDLHNNLKTIRDDIARRPVKYVGWYTEALWKLWFLVHEEVKSGGAICFY